MTTGDPSGRDPAALLQERMAQYGELWNGARTKLAAGDYHAEDLVDDWFRWWGMAARDAIAAVALIADAVPRQRTEPPPEAPAG